MRACLTSVRASTAALAKAARVRLSLSLDEGGKLRLELVGIDRVLQTGKGGEGCDGRGEEGSARAWRCGACSSSPCQKSPVFMLMTIGYVPGLASTFFQIAARAGLFSSTMPSIFTCSSLRASICVSTFRCATMMSCEDACSLHR